MRDRFRVLDAMCGIGYGSYIMGLSGRLSIQSFDFDQETIDYARKWYQLPNITYRCNSYQDASYEDASFDRIVCFEGIEHIGAPKQLLQMFHKMLKDDGLLLLSTPNGVILPFDKVRFPEHLFHYMPKTLELDLNSCGFKVDSWHSQANKHSMSLDNHPNGAFMLCVASKI